MYKQVFDLVTGECLDDLGSTPVDGLPASLTTWDVQVADGAVLVGDPAGRRTA
jgi:nitrite reductase (NADH) small subunit